MGVHAILGIDPGSRITGYAALTQEGRRMQVIESGIIALRGTREMACRLGELQQRLEQIIDRLAPQEVVLEDVFAGHNVRSALKLGQARGAILALAGRRQLKVTAYSPAAVKRAVTGHGRADKMQIQKMVRALLSLATEPSADEADAMAIAICHCLTRRIASGVRPSR